MVKSETVGRSSAQRKLHLLQMIEALSNQPQTITELTQKTLVSRPAAKAILVELQDMGWVTAGEQTVGIGRPAVRWSINPSAILVVGLQIDSTVATAVVCDYSGTIRSEREVTLSPSMPTDERLQHCVAIVKAAVDGAGFTLDDISVCSVAAPGVINAGSVSYFHGKAMPGWLGLNLADALENRLGLPVLVERDFALGALGETWQGAAVGHPFMLYVHCETNRLGAASIIDGKVHAGHFGMAGLVELLPQLRWPEIETNQYARYVLDGDYPGLKAAIDESPTIREALFDISEALALGISGLVLALAPSQVVISGEVTRFSDVGLARFTEMIHRRCPVPPEVVVSTLGRRGIVLGAVRQALDIVHTSLRQSITAEVSFPSARFRPDGKSVEVRHAVVEGRC